MLSKGFVLDPYHELLPDYKICPFSNSDLVFNKNIQPLNLVDNYFRTRFGHNQFYYTENGRQAIAIALDHYNLNKNDVITILTTTNNFYISSCVTNEIEKICKWSRNVERNTKLIFVNHEFGFPYEDLDNLLKFNLPIIEDCAHSFFSKDKKSLIGKVGDFVIYSFPKMFPIQVGGLLVSNIHTQKTIIPTLPLNQINYIKNVISFYINDYFKIIENRTQNYLYLEKIMGELNIYPRFDISSNVIPGVFMFKSSIQINYPELKIHLYKHGIQCSVFYGEQSFFIPNHQNLNFEDLNYFKEVIREPRDCELMS